MAASRAAPFGDLSEFQPRSARPQPATDGKDHDEIDRLAWASGFPSRQAPRVPTTSTRPTRRHTTGRNQQINVKATAETIAQFYRLADERNVVLGELLELALNALESGERTR